MKKIINPSKCRQIITYLLLAIFFITTITAGAAPVSAQNTTPRRAVITSLEGSVLIQAAGQATAVLARRSMEIKSGDRVITGRDGKAEIRYDDGSTSRIGPNSRVDITNISRQGADGPETTIMSAQRGSVWNNARDVVQRNSRFEVNTPAAVAGVRGTNFLTRVLPTGDTLFRGYSGQFDVGPPSPDMEPDDPDDIDVPPPPPPPPPPGISVGAFQQFGAAPDVPLPPAPDPIDFDDIDDFELTSLAEDDPEGLVDLVNQAKDEGKTDFLKQVDKLLEDNENVQENLGDKLDDVKQVVRDPEPDLDPEHRSSVGSGTGSTTPTLPQATFSIIDHMSGDSVLSTISIALDQGYLYWDLVSETSGISYTFSSSNESVATLDYYHSEGYHYLYVDLVETGTTSISVTGDADGYSSSTRNIDLSVFQAHLEVSPASVIASSDFNQTFLLTLSGSGFDDPEPGNISLGGDFSGLAIESAHSTHESTAEVSLSGNLAFSSGTGTITVDEHGTSAGHPLTVTVVVVPDTGTGFAGGDGSEENPYQIENWHHLNNVKKYGVVGGTHYEPGTHFVLNNDLGEGTDGYEELASALANDGVGWQPIGSNNAHFTGTLDGDGNTISNLFIDRPSNYIGLFGYAKSDALIKNLSLSSVEITANNYVGSLIGWNIGTVEGITSSGNVAGKQFVGGLIGKNSGTISNSNTYGIVSKTGSDVFNEFIGGLVGSNSYTIDNSYSESTVTGNSRRIGGLVGENFGGTINNSYATGNVSVNTAIAGGLVGENTTGGVITNSYATGNVAGGGFIGGLAGRNTSTIEYTYATGNVTGSNDTGGLVGYNEGGTITSSFAEGNITASFSDAGGLVGRNGASGGTNVGSIIDCYAIGSVQGNQNVGGLVGNNDNENSTISNSYSVGSVTGTSNTGGFVGRRYLTISGTITNTYWDTGTSNQTVGVGTLNDVGVTGRTTEQMTQKGTFEPEWDFMSVWNIDEDVTYPYLRETTPVDQKPMPISMGKPDYLFVEGTIPENEAIGVSINTDISIYFDRMIRQGASGFASIELLEDSIPVSFTAHITGDGFDLVLTPDESFAFNTTYTVIIPKNAVEDDEVSGVGMEEVFMFTFSTEAGAPVGDFAYGDGLEGNPYQIEDWHHLNNVKEYGVVGGVHYQEGTHFILNNDLCVETPGYHEFASAFANDGAGWDPVGPYVGFNNPENAPFTGTFDGNGFTINNLYIDRPNGNYVGLFGYTSESAVLKNLHLTAIDVKGHYTVGGLVAENHGLVNNCHITGDVKGYCDTGGLVGSNIGGNKVINSSSEANIKGFDSTFNSYNLGGLVGANYYGSIENSYATGNVAGTNEGDTVGGLVGLNCWIITDSYATGNVYGYNEVGGLVGSNEDTISNSYSTGYVEGEVAVGGLVGLNSGDVENSYWDIETSGQTDSDGGTGKTTAEMTQQNTFELNWDFTDIWDIDEGVSYPYLQWQTILISTESVIDIDVLDPSVTITLEGDTFHETAGEAKNTENWIINKGTTNLSVVDIARDNDNQVTISFTGVAEAGSIQIQAKAAALTGNTGSNMIALVFFSQSASLEPGDQISYTGRGVDFFMRYAPAVTFPFGNSNDEISTLQNDFWVAETPVTYELWNAVRLWASANGYTFANTGRMGSEADGTGMNNQHPVTTINWRDSIIWCNALSELLGYDAVYTYNGGIIRNSTDATACDDAVQEENDGFRLPTRHEWELTARWIGTTDPGDEGHYGHGKPLAGDRIETEVNSTNYYWTPGNYASGATDSTEGNPAATVAVAVYDSSQTAEVKTKLPNALELYDMSGNIAEWTFENRVKGGSWWESDPYNLRIGRDYGLAKQFAFPQNGLRFVRTAP